MIKVISFCLYGSGTYYSVGALENLRLAKTLLPGWGCRFYVETAHPLRKALAAGGAEVIDCGVSRGSSGMFWRFRPMADPEVDRFIVRDVDARLLQRDVVTVRDWESSKKPFVLWRDHPCHHARAIMGGGWGSVVDITSGPLSVSARFTAASETALTSCVGNVPYGFDEAFLEQQADLLTGGEKTAYSRMLAFAANARPQCYETPFPPDAPPRVSDSVGFIGARCPLLFDEVTRYDAAIKQ